MILKTLREWIKVFCTRSRLVLAIADEGYASHEQTLREIIVQRSVTRLHRLGTLHMRGSSRSFRNHAVTREVASGRSCHLRDGDTVPNGCLNLDRTQVYSVAVVVKLFQSASYRPLLIEWGTKHDSQPLALST